MIDESLNKERVIEALFNNSLRTIFLMDISSGKLLALSERLSGKFGLTPTQMIGRSIYEFLPPDIRKRRLAHGKELMRTGEPVRFVDQREQRWYDTTFDPVRNESGYVTQALVYIDDITDQRKAEEALHLSETELAEAQRLTQIGSWSFDVASGKIHWSDQLYHIYGVKKDRFGGEYKSFLKCIHPDDRALVVKTNAEAKTFGIPFEIEYRIAMPRGKFKIVRETGHVSKDESGKIVRLFGTAQDITRRRKAEQLLRSSKERYRKVNKELLKSRDELERRVQERTAELETAYDRLSREIEEREQTEERLRQSQKMEAIGTLAGGIAHDFNNILAGIIGFAEMIEEDLPQDDKNKKYIQRVLKASHRGKELIRQILTFSRKTTIQRKPIIVSAALEETFNLLRSSIPSSIEMRLSLMASDDKILAAPSELQQILMNLATNAAAAMRDNGGFLTITTVNCEIEEQLATHLDVKPGRYLQLIIEDTGNGIPPEIKERIFEPFFTTKEPGKGTGLGLAVVYGTVKNLAGGIALESTPGRGSTFNIYLPVVNHIVNERTPRDQIPGGSETILFVDDEEMISEWGQNVLQKIGYKVTSMTDASQAFKIFSSNPPSFDLVILDQTMPQLTGYEFARKALELRPNTPIILCTGHSDQVSEKEAIEAGIREFLMKPVEKKDLADAIRRALG